MIYECLSKLHSDQSLTIMIQRSLLRQSQAACLRSPATYLVPRSRVHFPPVRIAPRCYSTATGAQDSANADASPAEAFQSEAKDEDLIKKDLESKNREIIDLKVRPHFKVSRKSLRSRLHFSIIGQISPFSSRLSQPSRPNKTRYAIRP